MSSTSSAIPVSENMLCSDSSTTPIFFADSGPAAKQYILSNISDDKDVVNIRVQISEEDVLEIYSFLEFLHDKRHIRRYVYDPHTKLLGVVAMGSPIHDAVPEAIANSFLTNLWCLPEKLRPSLSASWQSRPMSSSPIDGTAQAKIASRDKFPDLAIAFSARGEEKQLTVIFEVGFSERYEDLVSDAKQWLIKNERETNIAIIVEIKEKSDTTRATAAGQARLYALVSNFGNQTAKQHHGREQDIDFSDSSELDTSSQDGTTRKLKDNVFTQDGVGSLTATLEIWELVEGTPQKRGWKFTILPEPKKPREPAIRIIDMIPKNERANFTDIDTESVMKLDVNSIRRELHAARNRLALRRARLYTRPKPRTENDGEFQP